MNLFLKNFFFSWTILLLSIIFLWLINWFNNIDYWKSLILCFMVYAYWHYIIWFFYQYKSLLKQKRKIYNIIIVSFITIIFTIPIFLLSINKYLFYIPILIIWLIFLIHISLNAKTMIEKFNRNKIDNSIHLSIPILLLFFINSLKHPLSSPNIFKYFQVENLNFRKGIEILFNILEIILPILIATILIFSIYYLVKYFKEKKYKYMISIIIIIPSIFYIFFFQKINIVYYLTIVSSIHIISWLIYYIQKLKKEWKNKMIFNLIASNIIVYWIIIILLLYSKENKNIFSNIYLNLYTLQIFFIFTFLHIFSSFFNEKIIKKVLKIY